MNLLSGTAYLERSTSAAVEDSRERETSQDRRLIE